MCLKEFLCCLDTYSVEHDSESIIRAKMRKNNQCITRSKQYFLNSSSTMTSISRKSHTEVKCKPCICIPSQSVPKAFLDHFDTGYNYSYLFYNFYLFIYVLLLFKASRNSMCLDDSDKMQVEDASLLADDPDKFDMGMCIYNYRLCVHRQIMLIKI